MIAEYEIREILKPAGLDSSPDCIEAFLYFGERVEGNLDVKKSDVLALLGKAALQLKSRAGTDHKISGTIVLAIFRDTFKQEFEKFKKDNYVDPEHFAFSLEGPQIRSELVLTSAPLDLTPIARNDMQKKRGRDLAEAAKELKGFFYWAGPGELDNEGKLAKIAQRKPGTISLSGSGSKKIFKELDMMTPSGEPHHPVGAKPTRDQMLGSYYEYNPNDFTTWLLHGGEVTTEFRCNCWEAILVSAWWADLIEIGALRNLYEKAIQAPRARVSDFPINLLNFVFQFQRSEVLHDYVHPREGDIIFFDGPAHVAVATGVERNVMSLWHQQDSAFVEISIDILKASVGNSPEVRFVPCPF